MPASKEIREARIAAGLTRSQAADLVMVKPGTWSAWEQGARNMPPLKWRVFLEAIKVHQ